MHPLHRAASALASARRVLALTGAGVSAESGVPTFRGPQGLWRNFRPEELATPEAFRRDPLLVWEWYRWRQQQVAACRPNPGHEALVRLEAVFAADAFTLVTQNVDDLHQRAGSRRVLALHGNLSQARCTREGTVRDFTAGDELPPRCACGAMLRPNLVWFGEPLDARVLAEAFAMADGADVCLVAGTSGLVSPAAMIPIQAARSGATVIEINPERTPLSDHAHVHLAGHSGEILPRLLETVLKTRG